MNESAGVISKYFKPVVCVAGLLIAPSPCRADKATVMVNNYDAAGGAGAPLYFVSPIVQLPTGATLYIQLLAGPVKGPLSPVTDMNGNPLTITSAVYDAGAGGYMFDVGPGLVVGLADYAQAQFELVAWVGAATYDAALYQAISPIWTQVTGGWNSQQVPPAPIVAPALQIPGALSLVVNDSAVAKYTLPRTLQGPPTIVRSPPGDSLRAGGRVVLSAVAATSSPLSYQWSLGGADLAGATNATLVVANLTPSQAGSYGVTVTDQAGNVASAATVLAVQFVDTDGNGLPDDWEVAHFGSTIGALATADSDGDGYSNREEYLAGTDPLDPASALRVTAVQLSGNDLLVTFPGVVGRPYWVESIDSLGDLNLTWTLRSSFTNGTDGPVQMLDAGAAYASANRFYRIRTGSNGEVVSDPVGYYALPLNPGPNPISVPLHPLPTARAVVVGISGNTVTLSGNPGWTADALAPANGLAQYLLLVRKDVWANPGVEGDWWPVTGNSSNAVTLDPGSNNLDQLLQGGDLIEIRRLTSIRDLFGAGASLTLKSDHTGLAATGDFSQADVVRFISGSSFGPPLFYHDGTLAPTGYYLGGAGPSDGSTLTVLPGQALMLFRPPASSPASLRLRGQVQVGRLTHYLQAGPNAVGSPFAGPVPLGASNLKESGWHLDSTGAAASGDSSQADLFRVVVGTSFGASIFYHDGTILPAGWYSGSTPNNNFPLQPGQVYILFLSGPNPQRWRQAAPHAP